MYRPNFCSECGAKVIRLNWHFWHSRRFCDRCSKFLRQERLKAPLITALILFCFGLIAGRAGRQAAPPLIIERKADSPLADQQDGTTSTTAGPTGEQHYRQAGTAANSRPVETDGPVYLCGARTKKGTPCSRRMHSPVRCWQHKGMPAMLPPERLIVQE